MSAIFDAFAALATARRDDEAIWSRGEGLRLSFAEVAERVEDWRRALDAVRGPVAVAVGNRASFIELFLALRANGVVVVTLDGGHGSEEAAARCRLLGVPTLLHVDSAGAGVPLAAGVRCREIEVEPAVVPHGTALVKLTSGSTGEPTGICFDEPALRSGIEQIGAGMEIRADDRVLMAVSLSHSYGFDNGVLSFAVLGTPLILEPAIYPGPLLRASSESGATFLPLVPPLARALGESRWPSEHRLRRVICAGGVLPVATAQRFREAAGLPIHDFYGSTETGGICFERRPEETAAAGTVGKPLPGVRIELAGGRVVVHSAANRIGRLGEADRCDAPVTTGDTAQWTPEGRLQLIGRSADFLNIGGRKVAVVQVEAALERVAAVREAAVVGVEDAMRGERTVAFLVTEKWPIDLRQLPAAVTPREVRRVEALPYTERGKLDRARLRAMAQGGKA